MTLATTQAQVHNAFVWVRQVYDEAAVLLVDATRFAGLRGYLPWPDGVARSHATLEPGELPFLYLAGSLFSPVAEIAATSGTAMFLAIDFHSEGRKGPHLLVGAVKHATRDGLARAIDDGPRLLGGGGRYLTRRPKRDDAIFLHTPSADASAGGVEEIRHAELPLAYVDREERLRRIVDAAVELRDGDAQAISALVREGRTWAG